MYTFRAVLKDANFGEMFVGSYKPASIDNLFISIQTFNSQDFTAKTTPGFYGNIIVDEFHHAAALTYQKLLAYYQPRILLDLTATPERMDGKSVFGICILIRLSFLLDLLVLYFNAYTSFLCVFWILLDFLSKLDRQNPSLYTHWNHSCHCLRVVIDYTHTIPLEGQRLDDRRHK